MKRSRTVLINDYGLVIRVKRSDAVAYFQDWAVGGERPDRTIPGRCLGYIDATIADFDSVDAAHYASIWAKRH